MGDGELSDGSPCLRHHCITCCIETEMPLTDDDLKNIEKLGFKRADFTVMTESETRLKNKGKQCFFLKEGRCRIYDNRPEGCRIYPLVYDVNVHKFGIDSVCPYSNEFKTTREDKDHLKHLIRRLEREAAKRTKAPSLI